MDIFEKMESEKDKFTRAENKIYSFIRHNPETAATCTIVLMAELSECSKSAVLRFCQKIGYMGYSEFRYDLIKYNRQTSVSSKDSPKNFIKSCVRAYQDALTELGNIKPEQFSFLTERIIDASVVRVLGLGESGSSAQYLASNLNLLGKPAIAVTDMIEYFRAADAVDPEGLYIFFSVHGKCKAYQELPEALKTHKARIILITSSSKAPLKKYADETILLPVVSGMDGIRLDIHGLMFIFVSILNEYCRQRI